MSTSLFTVTEHIIPATHIREYASAVRADQEAVLRLHIRQYVPKSPPLSTTACPAITIISTHGNGFPKETHEALWDDLLSALNSHPSPPFTIASIWIADPTHQGLSYTLNEDLLSDDPSWLDHSRDTLHMINHFREHMKRPLVGIGHSMGGAQLVHLATIHPRLLTSLVLLDPVITPSVQRENGVPPNEVNKPGSKVSIARASTFRRDLWPTRAEASKAMRRAPLFAVWDERAWAAFVRHGLRDVPTAVYPEGCEQLKVLEKNGSIDAADPPVTLATPVQQEVHTFMRANFRGLDAQGQPVINRKTHADLPWDPSLSAYPYPYPFYRVEATQIWHELPALRPATLFILGGESFTAQKPLVDASHVAGTGHGGSGGEKEGKVKRVIFEGVGHEVPFVAPKRVAGECIEFLGGILGEWAKDEAEWKRGQEERPEREHVVPSEEWKEQIGGPLVRAKKPAGSKL